MFTKFTLKALELCLVFSSNLKNGVDLKKQNKKQNNKVQSPLRSDDARPGSGGKTGDLFYANKLKGQLE